MYVLVLFIQKNFRSSKFSLKEGCSSRGSPEIVKFNVKDGSFESIQSAIELAPPEPYFLGSRVHDYVIVVSSAMIAGDVAEHGLGSDLSVLRRNNICHAWITGGLGVFVEKEYTVKLRMSHWIVVSVVLVIIEIEEV